MIGRQPFPIRPSPEQIVLTGQLLGLILEVPLLSQVRPQRPEPDPRSFGDAATLLSQLRLNRVRLLTNNPAKVDGLLQADIQVHREMLLDDIPSEYALAYLIAKEEHGHQFRQGPIAVDAAGL